MVSEPGPEEREQQLAVLRRRVRRAARRGDEARFRALSAEYEALKEAHVQANLEEYKARIRAARAQREAQQPVRSGRWRLPFRKSPGALERDRLPPPPVAPQLPPGGHLSPWRRRGSPLSQQVWRPGS